MKFTLDPAEEYNRYLKRKTKNFELGNRLLYDLCKKHPYHMDADEIHSKVKLIGRVYAAAIERRRGHFNDKTSDRFYRETVVHAFKTKGKELDAGIAALKASKGRLEDNAEKALELHKLLLGIIHGITQTDKRSLASKYLHFHCPACFPLYDTRARGAASKIVHRPDVPADWKKNFDPVYADFFARILAIAEEIEKKTGQKVKLREIDDFLLDFDARH